MLPLPSDVDEPEQFYDQLESILVIKSTVVMGNFSGELGHEWKTEKRYSGRYGVVEWNDRHVGSNSEKKQTTCRQ